MAKRVITPAYLRRQSKEVLVQTILKLRSKFNVLPKGRWLNEWGKQMLKVAFERECPITKITVGWYECTQVQLGLFPAVPTVQKQVAA